MSREMKDSGIKWIGNIPNHWKVPKMNYICNTITDFVASGSFESLRINVPYLDSPDYAMLVRTTDLSGSARSEKRVYISKHSYDFLRNSNLFGGEIVLPNIGAVGDVYIVPKGMYEKMSLAPNAIMFKSNYLDKFYFYYFYCMAGRQSILELCQSTAQAKFNKTQLRSVRVLLPPLTEQQKIADYLDKVCGEIDDMIALQEKMIEELKAYKQSVITEAVTKGLNPNVPMRDSGIDWIGDIPEHWEVKPLKRVISKALQYGANESGILFDENLPRYVRITDILDNSLREDLQKQSLSEEQAEGYILEDKDLLFARSGGTVGKTFLYKSKYGRCAFAGYLIKASISDTNDACFVYYYTQSNSYEEWKRRIFIQSTIQNIGADRYSLMELPIPPLSEQRAIANFLDTKCADIDALIAIKQQKIEELKDYKKSVIYEYVTGKKQVN